MRHFASTILHTLGIAVLLLASQVLATDPLHFIDTSFENASPLDWEVLDDGTVRIDLIYDHERDSPNRAAGHWHFRVDAEPGSELTLLLNHFSNVWNGRSALACSDATIGFISPDGKKWQSIETEFIKDAGQLRFTVTIPPSGSLWVARLPPYRISDLNRLLNDIAEHPLVEITPIGETVQQRPLEIVRIGREDAPNRVFVRARAHPWEPGGNWVVEGTMRHLLKTHDDQSASYLDRYCVYIMPMANKDGVAMGPRRYTARGLPGSHESPGITASQKNVVPRRGNRSNVPQFGNAGRRLAVAFRHRRRDSRAECKLDRRTAVTTLCRTLDDLRPTALRSAGRLF